MIFTLYSMQVAIDCSIFIILFFVMETPMVSKKSLSYVLWTFVFAIALSCVICTLLFSKDILPHTLICRHPPT